VEGSELPRLDFGNFNRLGEDHARRLLEELRAVLASVQIVVINEQIAGGIHGSSFFRAGLQEFIREAAARDCPCILDSRHHHEQYAGVMRKLNAHEAAHLCGMPYRLNASVPEYEAHAAAEQLFARWRSPLFVTRGAQGVIVQDAEGSHDCAGIALAGPVDPVGAGDAMLAGIAAATAIGSTPSEAAALGNLAASVTVRKLHQTGTASPEEILTMALQVQQQETLP
jgi:sugar/nucleoside kinase (ribokinase family)